MPVNNATQYVHGVFGTYLYRLFRHSVLFSSPTDHLTIQPQPRLGCWELMSTSYNGGLDVEKEACLYVGDAAGRPKQGTYKKVKTLTLPASTNPSIHPSTHLFTHPYFRSMYASVHPPSRLVG